MFHIISCMAYGIMLYEIFEYMLLYVIKKYLMTSNFHVKFTSKVSCLT